MDIETRGRCADLPGIAILRCGRSLGDRIDIHIIENDDRRVAPEFKSHPLHALHGQTRELLAHDGGPREGYSANNGRFDQRL